MFDEACCWIAFASAPEIVYRLSYLDESHGV
jgi:hypothetical protein